MIGIDVGGTGTALLLAGVIFSTTFREENHFNMGSLEAHSLENSSTWKSQRMAFRTGAGSGLLTGSMSQKLVGEVIECVSDKLHSHGVWFFAGVVRRTTGAESYWRQGAVQL